MNNDKKISEHRQQYLEKLKDPRWQKLRLKVFERDEWTCQMCYTDESTLAVHHRYYLKNKEPWEFPLEALVTLCEECHAEERDNRPDEEQALLHALREKFLASDVNQLAIGFHKMPVMHVPEVVASVYEWALTTPEIQRELIDRYFEYIKQKANKSQQINQGDGE